MYYREVTGNLEEERQTIELWAPGHTRAKRCLAALLSAFACPGHGQLLKSRSKRPEKNPGDRIPISYTAMTPRRGRIFTWTASARAENVLSRGEARKVGASEFRGLRYFIAFMKGDQGAMDQAVAQARGESATEDEITHSEALVAARAGRLGLANNAGKPSHGHGRTEKTDRIRRGLRSCDGCLAKPVREHDGGEARRPDRVGSFQRKRCGVCRRSSPWRARETCLALKCWPTILAGVSQRTLPVKFTYMPVLRALSALGRGKPAAAVEDLQTSLLFTN